MGADAKVHARGDHEVSELADISYEEERRRAKQEQLERYSFKELEAELYRWGKWWTRHCEDTGHRSMTAEEAFRRGSGGGSAGHAILCLDWPTEAYATHMRILRLPEIQRDVIQLRYAICVKEDGGLWERKDWCRVYGISEDNFRKILERARHAIQGLI